MMPLEMILLQAAAVGSLPLTGGTAIGNLDVNGGINAAFDGVTSQTWEASARREKDGAGYKYEVGKDWGGASYTVTSFSVFGPNNEGISGNHGSMGIKLQGSNGSTWSDLWIGAYPGGVGVNFTVNSGITLAPFLKHRLLLEGDGNSGVVVAELIFWGY